MNYRFEATSNTLTITGVIVGLSEVRIPTKGGTNIYKLGAVSADPNTVNVGEWLRFERKVYS